jgi:metallo-beta-lactamase family protein
MKLTFIGADHEVTGSCHAPRHLRKHILVDYGMEQGKDYYQNAPLPELPGEIDAVLLTHAHMDHSGLLPLLYKNASKARYTLQTNLQPLLTSCCVTARIFRSLKPSGATVKPAQRRKTVCPLYTMEDAQGILKQFVPHRYDEKFQLLTEFRFVSPTRDICWFFLYRNLD